MLSSPTRCAARRPIASDSARRLLMLVLAALTLSALGACPDAKRGTAPKECTKAYEQCTLATGVLGVCDTVACGEGQPEPCLVCRSQH